MATLLFNDDELPKIPNNKRCHAILEDKTRCPNQTIKYINAKGKTVYPKWCEQHSKNCKDLNLHYKNSCLGFKDFRCNRSGTHASESTKKYRITECIKDRKDFESKCYYESERDQGHLSFLSHLQRLLDECSEIIGKLHVEQTKKTIPVNTTEEEQVLSLISGLGLTILSEKEKNKTLQEKKKKTTLLEAEKSLASKSKKMESLKIAEAAKIQKEKEEKEEIVFFDHFISLQKEKEKEKGQSQEEIVQNILLLDEIYEKSQRYEKDFETLQLKIKEFNIALLKLGPNPAIDHFKDKIKELLKINTDIVKLTNDPRYETISTKVLGKQPLDKKEKEYLQLVHQKVNKMFDGTQTLLSKADIIEKSNNKKVKEAYYYKFKQEKMEIKSLENTFLMWSTNLSIKQEQKNGLKKILEMTFKDWNKRYDQVIQAFDEETIEKFNQKYNEYTEWKKAKLQSLNSLFGRYE